MQRSRKDKVCAEMLPGTLCSRVCSREALPELCVTPALGSCSGCALIHEPVYQRRKVCLLDQEGKMVEQVAA